ncbi:5-formyltetrahydrofolate cyclo-ligase isoform X2 [Ahaetulla prasina]|uniref:5-formyltetrahydrofolate cyclo-ligase isoform X2 n=1 Tax=Ahaetulla prasina TaxID=499056 RepID=UPI0026484CB9|nr:5-formyltetrahydrofolate cyclo-ligase isoform X2 [Ahaetulla prasina]
MESSAEGGGGAAAAAAVSPADMAALHAAKRALRAELKRRLKGLSEAEKLRQSRLLAGKVMAHPRYLGSQRIAVFLSMPDEVRTNEIIKDIFQKGKECFIPWYKPQSSHMDMVKLASYEEIAELPLTSWNIHQPAEDDVREDALAVAERNALPLGLKRAFQHINGKQVFIHSFLFQLSSSAKKRSLNKIKKISRINRTCHKD